MFLSKESYYYARLAQSVKKDVYKAQGYGFESHCGQEFVSLYFSLSMRSWQADRAHTNEIKHAIHLR